jgi:glycosyltransferase involved in cell wall biosynthesis
MEIITPGRLQYCTQCKKYFLDHQTLFGFCETCKKDFKSLDGISVIILNWENPDRLKNCLEAIKNQTYPSDKVQVIVVDDGSKADIKSICDEYQIEFYTFPHSLNIGNLFNYGFARSKHEFMLLITQDHILSNDFLEKLCDRASNNVLFGARIFDSTGEQLYNAAKFRKTTGIPSHFDGFGVAVTKNNCPLFDTLESGNIYQYCNPRWLERVKAMGVDFQYHEDLIITHVDHERRE